MKNYNLTFNPIQDLSSFGSFVFFLFLIIVSVFFDLYLSLFLLIGLIIILLIALFIRTFYFKSRPNHEAYRNFIEKIDASSFPSVHAARVLFLAILFSLYFNKILLTILFFLLAFGTCWSRIYLKKHDIYDVIGGIFLGIITFFIIKLLFPI
ncbi:phosphatase PAP2 family protein [Candidatus Woesearchaeota archaeon]|nr:phosphatase PAP2 family protein [Candidatus Woesearchaeota archaeon]